MDMRRAWRIGVAAGALIVATTAFAQTEIKLGHVGEPGSLFQKSADEFARRANAKLGNNCGQVNVDLEAGIATIDGELEVSSVDVKGGVLRGTGTVDAPLVNDGGVIQPGSSTGILTIDDHYTQEDDGVLEIEIDETTTPDDLRAIVDIFGTASGGAAAGLPASLEDPLSDLPPSLRRTSTYLQHPVFNAHHSETEMMRYLKHLERKDIGLDISMIPLGSCTMKLNAATEMFPVSWPAFARLHPFAPADQAQGYKQVFEELEAALCEVTGFAAVSACLSRCRCVAESTSAGFWRTPVAPTTWSFGAVIFTV